MSTWPSADIVVKPAIDVEGGGASGGEDEVAASHRPLQKQRSSAACSPVVISRTVRSGSPSACRPAGPPCKRLAMNSSTVLLRLVEVSLQSGHEGLLDRGGKLSPFTAWLSGMRRLGEELLKQFARGASGVRQRAGQAGNRRSWRGCRRPPVRSPAHRRALLERRTAACRRRTRCESAAPPA